MKSNRKWKITKLLLALLFALLEMVSINIYKYGSYLEHAAENLLVNFIIFCVSFLLFPLMMEGILWITNKAAYPTTSDTNSRIKQIWEKKYKLLSVLLMVAGWAPWLIAYYPGSLFYDMTHQLDQYYGVYNLQTHPPLTTLVMGLCMDFGKNVFASDNIGLFIYILFQTIVCMLACEKAVEFIRECGVSWKWQIVCTAFFAFFPLFGSSVQCGQKDTANYGFTLLTCIYFAKMYLANRNNGTFIKKDVLLFTLWAFISCLWRKEMMYVYGLSVILLLIFSKSYKQMILYVSFVVILLSNIFTNQVIAQGIFHQEFAQGDAEAYSLPLQQVARVVYYNEESITEEEKQIIGECFFYDYDDIKANYNPNLSDPIKYNFDVSMSKKNGFWNVYFSLMRKNPLLYMESIIAGGYGYFYVGFNVPATVGDAPTNGLPGGRLPSCYIELGPDAEYNFINVSFCDGLSDMRTTLSKWLLNTYFPSWIFYSFGFWSWFVVICAVNAIRKQKHIQEFLPYMIALFLIMVCIASPVNDYGRYYIGIIFMCPVVWALSARKINATEIVNTKPQEEEING